MATDLRDRLRDLADHTPPVSPPEDLWTRGVSRRRVERAGTAVLAAALVLVVCVGGWTWHSSRADLEPVAPHGAPHLPDQFFAPSPWLHTFGEPPGALVAVVPAERKTLLHHTYGLVGITASSGTYGFLDLPTDAVLDANGSSSFALSPDGGRLAFWMSGTTTGSPNTVYEGGTTVTGLATYDTVTGRVRTYSIATVHGVVPSLLTWADNDTLAFSYDQIQGGDGSGEASSSSQYVGRGVWGAADAAPHMLRHGLRPSFVDNLSTRAADGSLVAPAAKADSWWLMSATDGSQRTRFRTRPATKLLVPSPDLSRVVAVLGGVDSETGPLAVAALPGAGSSSKAVVRLRTVEGAARGWFRPLAWVDDHDVAALHRVVLHRDDGSEQVSGNIELVDLRTGGTRTLVKGFAGGGTEGGDAWLATDLLGAPSVHASPPPHPVSPRALAICSLIGIVLIGGFLLLAWGTRGGRRA